MYSCVMFEEKWPVLVRHEKAAEWLQAWSDLERATHTIDAYGRGLAEYLLLFARGRASSRWRLAAPMSRRSSGS